MAQRAAYLEFLAHGERAVAAHDAQAADASALATLVAYKVYDASEVHLQPFGHECRKLLLRVFHRPLIEVGSGLVVVVEHLPDDLRVTGVAEGVADRGQISLRLVFPAVLILLSLSAAAFREACVAYLSAANEHFAAKKPSAPSLCWRRRAICASSHEREATA